ncbi:MAG: flavin reductase family protein [Lachnospiraceae bacterium]|nr:flavin reductase family protein [Lachnospiraceae bacterium]
MKKINLSQASKLTSPNPVTLICTQKEDGSTNLATVSWWTILSFHPQMVGFAMSKKSYTGERVRATRSVVITVPGSELSDITMKCGMTSGRNTDKVADNRIEMMPLGGSSIRIPKHSRIAIHCRLKEHHEVGDHILYICDVQQVFGDAEVEALFSWNGYAEVAPAVKG